MAETKVTATELSAGAIKLGVTNVTSTVTHTTTETTIASVTVIAPGGRDIELTITAPQIQTGVANDRITVRFKEGATLLQQYYHGVDTVGKGATFSWVVAAPSAGSHTYTVTGQRDVGTGSVLWYANIPNATIQLVAKAI